MSKPHPTPFRRLTCTDVRFVEVDFPRQLRPRLVIEFSEGLSLLLRKPAPSPDTSGDTRRIFARGQLRRAVMVAKAKRWLNRFMVSLKDF